MDALLTTTDVVTKPGLLQSGLHDSIHQEAVVICHPIKVDAAISEFLSSIILESVSFRQDEWQIRGVDPSEVGISQIVAWVRPSLVTLLSEASMIAQYDGRNYILLIDILAALTKRWCKIFPFCREFNAYG